MEQDWHGLRRTSNCTAAVTMETRLNVAVSKSCCKFVSWCHICCSFSAPCNAMSTIKGEAVTAGSAAHSRHTSIHSSPPLDSKGRWDQVQSFEHTTFSQRSCTFEKCAAALSSTNLRLQAAVSRMMRPSASAVVRPLMKPFRACRAET